MFPRQDGTFAQDGQSPVARRSEIGAKDGAFNGVQRINTS